MKKIFPLFIFILILTSTFSYAIDYSTLIENHKWQDIYPDHYAALPQAGRDAINSLIGNTDEQYTLTLLGTDNRYTLIRTDKPFALSYAYNDTFILNFEDSSTKNLRIISFDKELPLPGYGLGYSLFDGTISSSTYFLKDDPTFGNNIYSIKDCTFYLYDLNDNLVFEPINPTHYYLDITSPPDNYQTVNKEVEIFINYSLKLDGPETENFGTDAQNPGEGFRLRFVDFVNLEYTYLKTNENVKDWRTRLRTYNWDPATKTASGIYSVLIQFNSDFLGTVDIEVDAGPSVSAHQGEYLFDQVDFEIVEFIDLNNDGLDDNTNEPEYVERPLPNVGDFVDIPTSDMYDDSILGQMKYGFDKLLYFIQLPFKAIGSAVSIINNWLNESMSWLSTISNLLKVIFGFLPDDVINLIVVIISAIFIFSIFKLARG